MIRLRRSALDGGRVEGKGPCACSSATCTVPSLRDLLGSPRCLSCENENLILGYQTALHRRAGTLVDFPVFDADNHYYEALDAFTRYIDPAMRRRAMQWATIDGKERLLVGGRVNRFIPNPTFENVSRPGALSEYFRAKAGVGDMRSAFGELEPIASRPEYRDRQARLRVMDQQGLEACIMLPTIGVGMEAALEHDQEACAAVFTAFNRWLDEDWGLNFEDRIYGAPYVSLIDLDWAVSELEWALDHDVRVVLMRPGSVNTRHGRRTPGDPAHDPFWARLNEAGDHLGHPWWRLRLRRVRADLGFDRARSRRSGSRRSRVCFRPVRFTT